MYMFYNLKMAQTKKGQKKICTGKPEKSLWEIKPPFLLCLFLFRKEKHCEKERELVHNAGQQISSYSTSLFFCLSKDMGIDIFFLDSERNITLQETGIWERKQWPQFPKIHAYAQSIAATDNPIFISL